MGDPLNIPNPLTQLSSPPPPPPPRSPPAQRSNLPMLYYGLVVVATAAIVLAVYNLIIVRWCATQYRRQENQLFGRRTNRNNRPRNTASLPTPSLSRGGSTIGLVGSFRYKKGGGGDGGNKNQLDYDTECSVCLSVFEEGEEVRSLPRCNHSFHASCIDMWLYSHFDCPLCRAPVVELPPPLPLPAQPPAGLHLHRYTGSALSENSRDGLLDQASISV